MYRLHGIEANHRLRNVHRGRWSGLGNSGEYARRGTGLARGVALRLHSALDGKQIVRELAVYELDDPVRNPSEELTRGRRLPPGEGVGPLDHLVVDPHDLELAGAMDLRATNRYSCVAPDHEFTEGLDRLHDVGMGDTPHLHVDDHLVEGDASPAQSARDGWPVGAEKPKVL